MRQLSVHPSEAGMRRNRRAPRVVVMFVPVAAVGLLVSLGVKWPVALIGCLSLGAAVYLDHAPAPGSRFAVPRWARALLWMAIPAAGIVMVTGVTGHATTHYGLAILVGPGLDRLKIGAVLVMQHPRVRRALATVQRAVAPLERLIGFSDVPKDDPAIAASPRDASERLGRDTFDG